MNGRYRPGGPLIRGKCVVLTNPPDDIVSDAERILKGEPSLAKQQTPRWAYIVGGFLCLLGLIAFFAALFLAWVGTIALGWHAARLLGWV